MACEECRPYGGLWRMAANGEGLERCGCEEGQRVAKTELARSQEGKPPVIENEVALVFCEMLAGSLKFFPGSGVSRASIASEIRSMCRNQDEALWLVQRMGRLYTDWPGTKEMRRVYCAKHIPLDGQIDTTESLAYPDGIPSERIAPASTQQMVIGAGGWMLQLPAAEEPTVPPEKLQRAVNQMVRQAPRIPQGSIGSTRFGETLKETITAPQDRPQLPGPAPQIITPQQVEQAARELQERRARGERMPWEPDGPEGRGGSGDPDPGQQPPKTGGRDGLI